MKTIEITSSAVCSPDPGDPLVEAHPAAAAFVARYQGRTLDAYRHDLRVFFRTRIVFARVGAFFVC